MKKNESLRIIINTIVFVILLLIVVVAASAQAPIYRFVNPTHTSGTAGNVNAVYRFPSVKTGVDALVRITQRTSGITLQNIDRTADGYSEAFQPEYRVSSLAVNAYIEFEIRFVQAGTNTNAPQPLVDVSGLDIDGGTTAGLTLNEFNRVDMGGGICTFNTIGSQITLSQVGTAYHGANFTGILFGALVDTSAKEVMFSVSNVNVTSFTYRVGASNLIANNSTRYASLYFKRFIYPNGSVLSSSPLMGFSGVSDDSKTKLKWTLSETNAAKTVVVEKSTDGKEFSSLTEFKMSTKDNIQNEFSYTDSRNAGAGTYYRLKVVGSDNKVYYSNILYFRNQPEGGDALAVYPSHVQSATTVSINFPEKQSAIIFVTDMSGRTVKQQNVLFQKGNNNVVVDGFERFRKGNYIVSVNTGHQKFAKQIVVQ